MMIPRNRIRSCLRFSTFKEGISSLLLLHTKTNEREQSSMGRTGARSATHSFRRIRFDLGFVPRPTQKKSGVSSFCSFHGNQCMSLSLSLHLRKSMRGRARHELCPPMWPCRRLHSPIYAQELGIRMKLRFFFPISVLPCVCVSVVSARLRYGCHTTHDDDRRTAARPLLVCSLQCSFSLRKERENLAFLCPHQNIELLCYPTFDLDVPNLLSSFRLLTRFDAGAFREANRPEPAMDSNDQLGLPGKDKGKFTATLVCWILGCGGLFAWNSMLTIEDYYVYLFPNYHPTRILTLVYQPFALGFVSLLAHKEARINTRLRNLVGYSLFFVSSFAIIVLDLASGGKGGIGPFIGLCIISAAFGTADAHVQGGMVGDLSLMCPEFIQSFLGGLAASGAITSALRLITKAAFESSRDGFRKGAILFFALSSFFELLCAFLYAFVFPKLQIVKHYRSKAAMEGSKTVYADLAASGIEYPRQEVEEGFKQPEHLSHKELLLQNMDYAADIYLIYVLTLSIFPGFLSEDTRSHSLGTWYVLTLIATYNVCDLIGRYTPLVDKLWISSRKGLTLAVLARFLFIPAFYFTAKYGDQGYMIMLTSLLGLTNGHLTVCTLTKAPKGYKGPEQNALGNLLVACLLAGIFTGVVLDWLWLIGKGW